MNERNINVRFFPENPWPAGVALFIAIGWCVSSMASCTAKQDEEMTKRYLIEKEARVEQVK